MDNQISSHLTQQWQQLTARYTVETQQSAVDFIQQYSLVLVDEFYKQMVLEPTAVEFFSDHMITQRLKMTLNNWLLDTFNVAVVHNYVEAVQKQQIVGNVHARVGIPPWLMIRGVRQIECKIFELIGGVAHEFHQLALIAYLMENISFSTEIICRSYEVDSVKHHESKNSYRLFSAMQDVAVQKDKQRSTLLDWENDLMYKVLAGREDIEHILLSKSEFGLWFIHKAAYAFSGSDQVNLIIQLIYQVDTLIQQVVACQDRLFIQQYIQEIRQKDREIQYLVDQLFQVSDYIDVGNDALTQLLSRRYLDTVIARETKFARKSHTALSILAIDADHFKLINDHYGHASGDLALKILAEILMENSKGSDYAFRVGGEEFLLLLVDTRLEQARQLAEQIRQQVEETVVTSTQNVNFNFTVSIGVKEYDGHPDYQCFLESVDRALYLAKDQGRNRVQS